MEQPGGGLERLLRSDSLRRAVRTDSAKFLEQLTQLSAECDATFHAAAAEARLRPLLESVEQPAAFSHDQAAAILGAHAAALEQREQEDGEERRWRRRRQQQQQQQQQQEQQQQQQQQQQQTTRYTR